MTAYGLVQCDEVVQDLLAGEALTLPRTSVASLRSGVTLRAKAKHICYTYIHTYISILFRPRTDHSDPLPLL